MTGGMTQAVECLLSKAQGPECKPKFCQKKKLETKVKSNFRETPLAVDLPKIFFRDY
jgi:hypothetical protein